VSRPALPEERGADLQPEPPTLAELRDEHAFEQEQRDLYELGDGARSVDVCQDCGLEQDARDRGEKRRARTSGSHRTSSRRRSAMA